MLQSPDIGCNNLGAHTVIKNNWIAEYRNDLVLLKERLEQKIYLIELYDNEDLELYCYLLQSL